MRRKFLLTIIFLGIIFAYPFFVFAQETGKKAVVPACYYLSGLENFEDRVFILLDEEYFDYQPINPNECFRQEEYRAPFIYSIKKKYFDEDKLSGPPEDVKAYLQSSYVEKQFNQLYFNDLEPISSSDKEHQKYLRIVYLENTDTINLEVEKLDIIKNDGQIQTRYLIQENQEKTGEFVENKYFKYIIIILPAIFGMVLLNLVNRKFKAKK